MPAEMLHLTPTHGRSLAVLAHTIILKITGHQTEGVYTLFEIVVPPLSGLPFLHSHTPQQTFYILEGDFEFGGVSAEGPYTLQASAGSIIHVPGRTLHTYKNVGTTTGRCLVITAPSGLEQCLVELDMLTGNENGQPDMARSIAICRKHQIEFLLPTSSQLATHR